MKPNKNNIESFFKEQFQDFEVSPAEHLWDNISEEIQKKESKKVIPLWYYASGIAASLLLFFGLYLYTNFNESIPINPIVFENTPDSVCPDNSKQQIVIHEYLEEEDAIIMTNYNKDNTAIKKRGSKRTTQSNHTKAESPIIKKKNNLLSDYVVTKESEIDPKQNSVAFENIEPVINPSSKNKQDIIVLKDHSPITPSINEENKSDEALAAELLKESTDQNNENKKETGTNKWSLQPQIGTQYYDSFSGSSIGVDFSENPQFLEAELSYGVRVAYQATPKLKIRTGFSFTNINLTTSSVAIDNEGTGVNEIFDNTEFSVVNVFVPDSGVNLSSDFSVEEISEEEISNDELINEDGENQEIIVDEALDPNSSEAITDEPEITPIESSLERGSISQQISYFEIPLEIAYTVLDKKIGIDLLGGMSTFILTRNESFFQSNNARNAIELGETSALNNTSFSANLGIAAKYNLAKNLSFNVEPIFKFQFNSFSDNEAYTPFFIGIYSGLIWKF